MYLINHCVQKLLLSHEIIILGLLVSQLLGRAVLPFCVCIANKRIELLGNHTSHLLLIQDPPSQIVLHLINHSLYVGNLYTVALNCFHDMLSFDLQKFAGVCSDLTCCGVSWQFLESFNYS
jgi:hypothetical protein